MISRYICPSVILVSIWKPQAKLNGISPAKMEVSPAEMEVSWAGHSSHDEKHEYSNEGFIGNSSPDLKPSLWCRYQCGWGDYSTGCHITCTKMDMIANKFPHVTWAISTVCAASLNKRQCYAVPPHANPSVQQIYARQWDYKAVSVLCCILLKWPAENIAFAFSSSLGRLPSHFSKGRSKFLNLCSFIQKGNCHIYKLTSEPFIDSGGTVKLQTEAGFSALVTQLSTVSMHFPQILYF